MCQVAFSPFVFFLYFNESCTEFPTALSNNNSKKLTIDFRVKRTQLKNTIFLLCFKLLFYLGKYLIICKVLKLKDGVFVLSKLLNTNFLDHCSGCKFINTQKLNMIDCFKYTGEVGKYNAVN